MTRRKRKTGICKYHKIVAGKSTQHVTNIIKNIRLLEMRNSDKTKGSKA